MLAFHIGMFVFMWLNLCQWMVLLSSYSFYLRFESSHLDLGPSLAISALGKMEQRSQLTTQIFPTCVHLLVRPKTSCFHWDVWRLAYVKRWVFHPQCPHLWIILYVPCRVVVTFTPALEIWTLHFRCAVSRGNICVTKSFVLSLEFLYFVFWTFVLARWPLTCHFCICFNGTTSEPEC